MKRYPTKYTKTMTAQEIAQYKNVKDTCKELGLKLTTDKAHFILKYTKANLGRELIRCSFRTIEEVYLFILGYRYAMNRVDKNWFEKGL